MIRATGRRTHLKSGRTYHAKYNPPKVEGKDDLTGEPLIHRDDDKEEIINKRLNFYHKVTEPILKHYEAQGKIWKIDGMLSITEVWRQVDAVVIQATAKPASS